MSGSDEMQDLEPFLEWLRSRGATAAQLAVCRQYAIELAKYPSLSAALRAYEEAGAAADRIAGLRQTAARIAEFTEATRVIAMRGEPPLELEPRRARPATGRVHDVAQSPRLGCTCRKYYDVYVDSDFGTLASMLGGGIGIGTLILIHWLGALAAAAIALGLAGLGGLATVGSICVRCEGCRCKIRDLDDADRVDLRKGRARVARVTLALLAGAALCGYLCWVFATSSVTRR